MKLLLGTFVIAASGFSALGQETPQPAKEAEAIKAKVIAELSAAGINQAVKNSPFSADEVNESVQTLADGNRIVRSSSGKFYRNSDGRVRREIAGGTGGMLGTVYTTGQGVSIVNPSINQKYLLDSKLKTAQVVELTRAQNEIAATAPKAVTEEEKAKALRMKVEVENKIRIAEPVVVTGKAPAAIASTITSVGTGQGGAFAYSVGGQNSSYETRTEALGTRDFEGVSAEGTRRVTTIPAGAIGNERPIEITYERWFSKDLGVVVFSKNSDPRFGDQTYKLTNIVRSEPDPSLFSVPTEYRKIGESPTVYRISGTKGEAETIQVKGTPTAGQVTKTKP